MHLQDSVISFPYNSVCRQSLGQSEWVNLNGSATIWQEPSRSSELGHWCGYRSCGFNDGSRKG